MKNKLRNKAQDQGHHYGVVVSSKDTIAQVYGLLSVTSGEMVINKKGNIGLVLNLGKYLTGIVTFIDNSFELGNWVIRLFNTLSTKVSPLILGNVFDSLGLILNNPNKFNSNNFLDISVELGLMIRKVEVKAPGIINRQPVYEPLFTGFAGVDGLLPLGQGQRELIIGDRQTGKTSLAVDVVLNQSNTDSIVTKYILL